MNKELELYLKRAMDSGLSCEDIANEVTTFLNKRKKEEEAKELAAKKKEEELAQHLAQKLSGPASQGSMKVFLEKGTTDDLAALVFGILARDKKFSSKEEIDWFEVYCKEIIEAMKGTKIEGGWSSNLSSMLTEFLRGLL